MHIMATNFATALNIEENPFATEQAAPKPAPTKVPNPLIAESVSRIAEALWYQKGVRFQVQIYSIADKITESSDPYNFNESVKKNVKIFKTDVESYAGCTTRDAFNAQFVPWLAKFKLSVVKDAETYVNQHNIGMFIIVASKVSFVDYDVTPIGNPEVILLRDYLKDKVFLNGPRKNIQALNPAKAPWAPKEKK
jgi:hypothetical protein